MSQNNCNFVKFSTKAYLLNPQAVDLFDLESSISCQASGYLCQSQVQLYQKQISPKPKKIEFNDQFLPECIKSSTQKLCLNKPVKIEEDDLANQLESVMKNINQETIGIQQDYKLEVKKLKSKLGSKQKLLESQNSKLNSFRCENQLLRNQVARLKEQNITLKQKYDQLLNINKQEHKIKKEWKAQAQKRNQEHSNRKNKINKTSNPLYLSQLTKQSKQQLDDQQQKSKCMMNDICQDKSLVQSHIEKIISFSKDTDNAQQFKIQSFSQTYEDKQANKGMMIQSQICQISKIAQKKVDSSFQDNLSWLKFVKNEVSQTNISGFNSGFDDIMKKKIDEYIDQIRKDFNLKKSQIKANSKNKRKNNIQKFFNK